MTEAILNNEAQIRLGFFLGIFVLMAAWEIVAPRRSRNFSRLKRWPGNLGIVAINTLLIRVLFPVAAAGLAVVSQQKGWGLLNNIELPIWLAVVLAVALLDLIIYWQHVLFHAVPVLWRLHRMHHTDVDLDVTSGARFHPIEIVLSMAIKLVAVAALGPPAVAVIIFEVLLNGAAMFNHSNIRIPASVDGILRLVVVTPDMHRVHHSVIPEETNSNFGFNLPWWDRVFGTYRAQPAEGHGAMTIGIEDFRSSRDQRLDLMLLQPFRGKAGNHPLRDQERPAPDR